jgi:hypothetical protein
MDVWFSGSRLIYRHFSAIATYQMVIEEILQHPISVDAHDEQFVQCVSPKD